MKTRSILRFCNGLLTFLVSIVLIVRAAYASYALWDNQQVYDAVENTMDDMRAIIDKMDVPRDQTSFSAFVASYTTQNTNQTNESQTETIAPSVTETPETGTEENPESSATAELATTDAPDVVVTEEPKEEKELSPFEQLRAINPEITAWITMMGTAIDYPVMQGSSNFSYLNKDVYGEFALAGSIFLDSRNDSAYQDNYSLLYGHDMSKHRMFSDLNLYKDEEFFKENHLGILLTPDGGHLLQTVSCIVTSAGNSSLFNPENWKHFSTKQMLEAVQEDALFINKNGMDVLQTRIDQEEPFRILALSTCSGEFTDARTILLTLMDP